MVGLTPQARNPTLVSIISTETHGDRLKVREFGEMKVNLAIIFKSVLFLFPLCFAN